MTLEQLEKGSSIAQEIEKCKRNIEMANYTQSEKVDARKTHLKVNGLGDTIEIPKSLFRIVGKLILLEYQQKLMDLEKELLSL